MGNCAGNRFFFYLSSVSSEVAEIAEQNFHNIIKTVVREYKWPPEVIGGFFFDDHDFDGIEYWYEDILKVNTELESRNKQNKIGK